ncbi:hypothetical protein F7725_017532 [Dissostichus mawsoni]|uniref:Uncharacterized protein n=1 Tax=Dissostichus mawsoni TaxID=36200 RepID=A0A7J5Z6Q9_DISMA|nr:hypothetical protein F7725_017532 [Dissostichus mawsoni]
MTPFQMQKKQMTQTSSRHRARSHLTGPISSIPLLMPSTLCLQHRKESFVSVWVHLFNLGHYVTVTKSYKLGDGGGEVREVGDVGTQQKGFVLAIVETPGQDDDVVDIQQRHDHNGGVTNTWREKRAQVEDTKNSINSPINGHQD